MSVVVRPYRRGGWEVDIRWRDSQGTRRRERIRTTVTSKSAAQRWGEARERELLLGRPTTEPPKEVPTLKEFWPRFMDGYARANRQKPSGIAGKETIGNGHLVPTWGNRPLDRISTEDVQRFKTKLAKKSPKTVNNILTVLNVLLKKAVEWGVISQMPCTIRLLPVPKSSAGFLDFEQYERLVAATMGNVTATWSCCSGAKPDCDVGK